MQVGCFNSPGPVTVGKRKRLGIAESDVDQAWLCVSQQPLGSLEEGKQVMVSTLQERDFGEQAVLMFIALGK